MGLLVDGEWIDQWYDTASNKGQFERSASQFRHWVTSNGRAGLTGSSGFKAERGRYHLYVSLACPWAHRVLLLLKLKGLEDVISVSVVNSYMGDQGWTFEPGPRVIPDTVNGAQFIHQIYTLADPVYSGRATVPVLWDKQSQTIVSNESAEIIRMLNSAFDEEGAMSGDYYPVNLRDQIDSINELIYENINNGVYRAGFATSQDAYEEAVIALFQALDNLEQRLSTRRYLIGSVVTEADWRLFTTLIRFDSVYFCLFKCNLRRLVDYPNLWNYLIELYQYPGVSETVDMDYIKAHYYRSLTTINPTSIIAWGPEIDFMQSHNRSDI